MAGEEARGANPLAAAESAAWPAVRRADSPSVHVVVAPVLVATTTGLVRVYPGPQSLDRPTRLPPWRVDRARSRRWHQRSRVLTAREGDPERRARPVACFQAIAAMERCTGLRAGRAANPRAATPGSGLARGLCRSQGHGHQVGLPPAVAAGWWERESAGWLQFPRGWRVRTAHPTSGLLARYSPQPVPAPEARVA